MKTVFTSTKPLPFASSQLKILCYDKPTTKKITKIVGMKLEANSYETVSYFYLLTSELRVHCARVC